MIPGEPRPRHGIFILLRRLRQPLIVLILVYAVAVFGFTVVPGTDPTGQPWTMSFLHAFYFVSFLGTTIGLGEIPYPFSDAQRLWATASIYGAVVAWLYAIGALFAVIQDPLFRRVLREDAVERSVRRMREPFYLLCGYDDTGHRVAHELDHVGARMVVVDHEQARVDLVDVNELSSAVPALAGDATDPKLLLLAGLCHPRCAGVLALTGSDQVNTKIALTARMLNPEVPVLCAAKDHAWHPRMAAAGADQIINPFDTFAERVALSIRTPSMHVIYEALTTRKGTVMDETPRLPEGRWILCGSDPFIRPLRRQLSLLGIDATVVKPADHVSPSESHVVRGDPTDPAVLRAADIESAAVLVAGTDVDIENLTITLAARSLNKRIAIVARQTQRRNSPVFRASPADLVTLSGHVVAAEVLRHIRAPLLSLFLRKSRDEPEAWAAALLQRLRALIGGEVLESWSVHVVPGEAPTVCAALRSGEAVTLSRLMTRTNGTGDALQAVPLLIQRARTTQLLPPGDVMVQADDKVLFCGTERARSIMRHTVEAHALAPQAPTPRSQAA